MEVVEAESVRRRRGAPMEEVEHVPAVVPAVVAVVVAVAAVVVAAAEA